MFVLIMFSPSCKTRSHEAKVTGKDDHRLHEKLQIFGSKFTQKDGTEVWFVSKKRNP